MKKVLYIVTIVLLLAVFCFSGFQVVNYFLESKEQAAQFDELAALKDKATEATEAIKETKPAETVEDTEPTEETEPVMLPEYAELYEMNQDLAGWMKIEGTEIDYPVMHTPGNTDYYLKRNFFGEESARGCLYAREECDLSEPSDNVTIYGHNMMDGSMFNNLLRYDEKKAWEKNSIIQFDTLYEKHEYEIFAVFKTTASIGEGFSYHQFVDAQSEEEFDKFIATCKQLAFYDTGITPEYGDKVICLSTCEYTLVNGRFVVCAVRIS
jgi:sortase B